MKTLRIPLLATLLLSLLLAVGGAGCATVVDVDPDASSAESEVAIRPRFELWRDPAGQYRFALLSAREDLLASSQGYGTRTNALNGLLSVLANGELAERYVVRATPEGDAYFELRAANYQVIATGEVFATAEEAGAAIADTMRAVDAYRRHWAGARGKRFEVFEGRDGRFYFRLRAGNGEIVLQSQGYTSQAAALNGAFSVRDHGVDAARYRVLPAVDGRWYFNLYASNGQVIGTSQMYASKYNAERGRDAIIALLPGVELL
jgi:uncharacterized protein